MAAVSISVLIRSPVITQEVPTNRASHKKVTVQGRKTAVEFGILLKKRCEGAKAQKGAKGRKKYRNKNVVKAKKAKHMSCEGEVGEKGCKQVAKAKWEKGMKAKSVHKTVAESREGESGQKGCKQVAKVWNRRVCKKLQKDVKAKSVQTSGRKL